MLRSSLAALGCSTAAMKPARSPARLPKTSGSFDRCRRRRRRSDRCHRRRRRRRRSRYLLGFGGGSERRRARAKPMA